MKRNTSILLTALFSLSVTIHAATVGGIELPLQQDDLKLQGAGLLKKGFVFKIYVGALYLENTNDANRVLSQVPKRIDIHYFRHIPKKHMVRVANATLRKNLSEQKYSEMLPKIEQLHKAFLNGKKGSRASILYRREMGSPTLSTMNQLSLSRAMNSLMLISTSGWASSPAAKT